MSMLSSQIDALREASRTYQRMGNRSASNMLKDAADTIWQLRDDLQRANAENAKLRKKADMLQWNSDCFIKIYGSWKRLSASVPHLERENAKLREERDHWHVEQVHAYGNWEDAHKRAIELEKQNAKLRRVIESEIHCMSGVCKDCVAYRPAEDGWCDQQVWLEELGIEGQL